MFRSATKRFLHSSRRITTITRNNTNRKMNLSNQTKFLLAVGGVATLLLLTRQSNTAFSTPKPLKELAPSKELQEKLSEYVVIDVRERNELVETGHVPTAIHVPLATVLDGSALDKLSFAKNKQVLVVCRSGARSRKASDYLLEHGFSDVTNLSTGTLGWIANGLDVTRVGA